jgi:hypothetical protein
LWVSDSIGTAPVNVQRALDFTWTPPDAGTAVTVPGSECREHLVQFGPVRVSGGELLDPARGFGPVLGAGDRCALIQDDAR